MEELTRHITHLGLSLAHRWAKGEPISSSTPYVCLIPAESVNDFVRVLPPQSFDNYVSIYDGRGLVRPILPRVTAIMPHLTHLCIDLTLGLPEQKGQGAFPPNEFNPQDSIDYIRRLNSEVDHLLEGLSSTAPHLHAARSPAETGPEPEAILPMRTLTHLAITAEAGWECKRRRQKETNEKLVGIFLSCAIGSQRTLRHLDLTGLGPALIHGLEGLELPNLELLRVGHVMVVLVGPRWEAAMRAVLEAEAITATPSVLHAAVLHTKLLRRLLALAALGAAPPLPNPGANPPRRCGH
jgi:hypothetical protein